MNLATLDVTKDQAREALIHYRRALREQSNSEYDAICKGYNRVMKGQRLIELTKVIAAGGADAKHRPRLAIMRADQRSCMVRAWPDGRVNFFVNHYGRAAGLNIRLPHGTMPTWAAERSWETIDAKSVVPIIPPQFLPKGALSRYHILWEATWEDVPVDPALLQHLGGDLWAVLAVWDLTPLEQAVLRGRANA